MRTYLILFLFTILLIPVFSQEWEDVYADFWTSFAISAEENAGLTSFPILEIPIGGDIESLGTAYTAVARDISFFDANPAASALLESTEIAFGHNNLIADVNLESVFFTQRVNDLGYGIGTKILHVPFTAISGSGQQNASDRYIEAVLAFNGAVNLGKNYYFSGIAIGLNIKAAYRSIPRELYAQVASVSSTTQSAIAIMADIGILTRFNLFKAYTSRDKNFSIGIAFKNVGPAVYEDALPTILSTGIAYNPLRFWLISFDLNIPINLLDPSLSEGIGFGLGTGVQLTDFMALQTGFLWKGSNPRFSLGGLFDLDPISFVVNYTFDISTRLQIFDRLSIQAKLNLGDEGRGEIQKQVDDLYIQALVALSKSDFAEVIRLCEEALALDPSFSPAQETLESAMRSIELDQRLEDIRTDRE
jgi:hypothetical protein